MTQLTGNGPAFTGQGSVGALFNNPLTNPITSNPRISFSHLNNQTQSYSMGLHLFVKQEMIVKHFYLIGPARDISHQNRPFCLWL